MCGKNTTDRQAVNGLVGSPPRVREKLNKDCGSFFFDGITPACAGKTVLEDKLDVMIGDHPRVCGKNATFKS